MSAQRYLKNQKCQSQPREQELLAQKESGDHRLRRPGRLFGGAVGRWGLVICA